ncbi:MAG: hypothetical protein PHY48_01865 [Candidatus Cloacimonetes bacterium]|nr:hypothetical protein [Candidatus Cloacimonadota bacterium]
MDKLCLAQAQLAYCWWQHPGYTRQSAGNDHHIASIADRARSMQT